MTKTCSMHCWFS